MKALTLTQPWAAAVAYHGKTIENRTWSTSHRGLIAVHAGQTRLYKESAAEAVQLVAERSGQTEDLVRLNMDITGAIIAVADLVDVCSKSRWYPFMAELHCDCGPWAQGGQHHYQLANVRPLPVPVVAKGAQRFWAVTPGLAAAVEAQLRRLAS